MIHGIGTDLLDARRIRAGLAHFGEHYADRILAPAEHAGYYASRDPARFLAKCFAAKEAFAKALGTGMRHPVSWQNISVTHDDLGRPGFRLAPELEQGLARRQVHGRHLSISDEQEMVVAFSILEQ